jgi:ATP-dependent protease HslVU (ClpYQ) peptidase subunit
MTSAPSRQNLAFESDPRPSSKGKVTQTQLQGKRVTLIAAFRCQVNGEPGVVICADSQETIGDYKVSVEKIVPRSVNHYELLLGGSGTGNLVDSLANTIERQLRRWPAAITEEHARQLLEDKLVRYTSTVVRAYQAELSEKRLDFIVCLREKRSGTLYLWKIADSIVEPIERFHLIGWEAPIYRYEVNRLYSKELDQLSAVVLAVHLLSLAGATSNYVSEPFQVFTINHQGAWPEPPEKIADLTRRITQVNNSLGKLLRDVPDFSVSDETFSNALELFLNEIFGLRNDTLRHIRESESPTMQAMMRTFRERNKK